MPARFYVDRRLSAAESDDFLLPPGAARHVQVLRLQPGAAITLFDGSGDEWQAEVLRMGRSEVAVKLLTNRPLAAERELAQDLTLALAMPANDRMDFLVEKATELGAAAVQPLMSERSVLRLAGERADKKIAHWQGVAVAAAEQCGRVRPTRIAPVQTLQAWLQGLSDTPPDGERRWLLSPTAAQALQAQAPAPVTLILSGPEGGLSPAEESAARAKGFVAMNLGPRILRADTAPLAVLSWLALS